MLGTQGEPSGSGPAPWDLTVSCIFASAAGRLRNSVQGGGGFLFCFVFFLVSCCLKEHREATSTLPGNLLEMQSPGHHPSLLN